MSENLAATTTATQHCSVWGPARLVFGRPGGT